eukprot:9236022-Pyramimonas_sp.AAC.1
MLQVIVRGPFSAIPSQDLQNLQRIGFPIQAASVRVRSQAARFRVAERVEAFSEAVELLFSFSTTDECCIAWQNHPLWKGSAMKNLRDNYSALTSIPAAPKEAPHIQ